MRGIAIGVLFGLVAGVTLIAVAISNGFNNWVKPAVIGPTLGAFLAALVGVGGAIWSHEASKREHQKLAKEEIKEVSLKIFIATLEMYGFFYMRLRELRRAEKDQNIRPAFIGPVGTMMLSAVNDVRHLARNGKLPAGIAASALMITRSLMEGADAIEFKEEHLQSPDPDYSFELNEEEYTLVKNLVLVLGEQDKLIRRLLETWHTAIGLEGNGGGLDTLIEEVLEQNRDKFMPAFQI